MSHRAALVGRAVVIVAVSFFLSCPQALAARTSPAGPARFNEVKHVISALTRGLETLGKPILPLLGGGLLICAVARRSRVIMLVLLATALSGGLLWGHRGIGQLLNAIARQFM